MSKICYNGQFIDKNEKVLSFNNRAFKYGDSFFETIRCVNGTPLCWEDHYFRIAGSFILLKMSIPDSFNLDYFKNLIEELLEFNKLTNCHSRVRISFFRSEGGYYLPHTNSLGFIIDSVILDTYNYELNEKGLVLGFYKENLIHSNHISRLKSNNRLLNILASIYAKENNFDDVLLLNTNNNIVESTLGNIFIIKDGNIITPPIEQGCVDGVMRKVIIEKTPFSIIQKQISISELLNADEVFISNVIRGIQWSASIDKKKYNKNNILNINRNLNQLI